jgi:hypothetical protein
MTEEFIECGTCKQVKKGLKIIVFRSKKYHEQCFLATYPYGIEPNSIEPTSQCEKETLETTREFMWQYFRLNGTLESFDFFVKNFTLMSEWLNIRNWQSARSQVNTIETQQSC